MSYEEHAKRELEILGYDMNDKEEGPNKWMVESVMELLSVFKKQGQSGATAPECIDLFKKLASFEPLSPLTGKESEWSKPIDGKGTRQNKRCTHVFINKDEQSYDIRGKVFIEPNGSTYTSKDSRVNITFPYVPKTEYVKVKKEE